MDVLCKRVWDLSDAEIACCRELTLPQGSMEPTLMRLLEYSDPSIRNIQMKRGGREAHVLLVIEHDEIIGWALIHGHRPERGWPARVFIFVGPAHRRRGVGSMLVAESQRRWDCAYCPWDEISATFYAAFNSLEFTSSGRDYMQEWQAGPRDRGSRLSAASAQA